MPSTKGKKNTLCKDYSMYEQQSELNSISKETDLYVQQACGVQSSQENTPMNPELVRS